MKGSGLINYGEGPIAIAGIIILFVASCHSLSIFFFCFMSPVSGYAVR